MSAKTIMKAATGRLKNAFRGDTLHLFAGRSAAGNLPPKPNTASPSVSRSQVMLAAQSTALESSRMREVEAEHDAILDQFEETARLGHVPADALIGQLHANHCAALAETKRQNGEAEEALEAVLRRLDARFPAPTPPEPEKPKPRSKVFRPLANTWTKPPRPHPISTAQ